MRTAATGQHSEDAFFKRQAPNKLKKEDLFMKSSIIAESFARLFSLRIAMRRF